MWFVTAGKAVFSAIAGLINALIKWAAIIAAYRLGRSRESAKVTRKTKDVLEEQLEIAAKAPIHRGNLLERMRERKRRN